MKIVLILISVLAALLSKQVIADEISGGPRVNFDLGLLIVPCVKVDDPGSKLYGRFFDVKLEQSGNAYELIYGKEEDPDVCNQLIEASLNADEDTSDVTGSLWTSAAAISYEIGSRGPAGGIVFYITDGGVHGLEVAPEFWYGDEDPVVGWGCKFVYVGADGEGIGTGASNTSKIVEACRTVGIPARIANDYVLNGYNDWFLPSKDELHLMYTNFLQAGNGWYGMADKYYWSSTEHSDVSAWGEGFDNGSQNEYGKNITLFVRVIRDF